MAMRLAIFLLIVLGSVCSSNAALAEETTFKFTSTLTAATDPSGLTGLSVGDEITGTYTFEDTTVGQGQLFTVYFFAVTDAQIDAGNLQIDLVPSVAQGANRLIVGDGETSGDFIDRYGLNWENEAVGSCGSGGISDILLLADLPSDFIVGQAIPTTPPDISLAARFNQIFVSGCSGTPDEFFLRNLHR